MFCSKLFALFLAASLTYAHPLQARSDPTPTSTSSSSTTSVLTSTTSAPPTSTTPAAKPAGTSGSAAHPTATPYTNMTSLYKGNKKFMKSNRTEIDNLIAQPPSFMFIGCSDNRLSPGAIFQAPVGSITSQNNIANQFFSKDMAMDAALTYAVETAGVKHVIVLGHYGCKGVKAAIQAPKKAEHGIYGWVRPISEMFENTNRGEIKSMRKAKKYKGKKGEAPPEIKADEPGYRALVEENVKASVKRIELDSFISKSFKEAEKAKKKKDSEKKDSGSEKKDDKKTDKKGKKEHKEIEVYVHGLVYDESTGEVIDLRISFGPPGKKVEDVPFHAIAAAKKAAKDDDSD